MNMVVHTFEKRWEILRNCFENHDNVAECVRKLRTDFGRRKAPSAPYVRYLVKKVKETGILIDKPKREKSKTLTEDADFGKKNRFSDEAHFDLGGYVNKQNCCIWGTENPHCLVRILIQRLNCPIFV